MKIITIHRRTAVAVTIIICCVFLFTKCVNKERDDVMQQKKDRVAISDFAGSASCATCHKKIVESHIHTAHYLSTRPASAESIKGSFRAGKNNFAYDSGMTIVMEKWGENFYQTGYYKGVEKIMRKFDIVVGSGAKGQTYITRDSNLLYQLPVSYFTAADNWANSPLFPTYPVMFNRPITSRCLECHSTYAKKISSPQKDPEEFDMQQMIYGVDCEKCHGPAAKHVAFQTENPNLKAAGFIINPASFSRQQSLELCALCHGGRLRKTKPSFEFIAGDRLSDYFRIDTFSHPNPDSIDVHGNQYGLLRASKCFRVSNTMTCTTCHNSHENERGNTALFSQRCMTCHSSDHEKVCGLTAAMGAAIQKDCISCHMPVKASHSITELLPGNKIPTAAMIRSHFIKIYPEETMKFQASLHHVNK